MSIGLESAEDLIADLERALRMPRDEASRRGTAAALDLAV
jgi:hypothetical protein